jgi:glycosyltransferase involved in cell wall biosynthesis
MHPPGDPGFEQLRGRARVCEAPLISIPDRGPWDWKLIGRLLHLCRRERVALWHGHDYKSNALGLLLKRFWPMRLVTTVHGWVKHTRRTPLYYWVDRLCLPRYEQVICVSEDLRQDCLAAGVSEERCILLENGIDTRQYVRQWSVQEAKEKLGFSFSRLLVGAVGRLSKEKGFDLLIQAAARLLKRGFDFDLCIIGEGDEQRRLEALIATTGCQGRIRLLGYHADPLNFYQAMDVFALSSLREGLPNVLLEAMAVEVPVVATSVAGIPRLIQDASDGLLVAPGDVDGLEKALALLLADAALRRRLGKAGRATVEARYSFQARMGKIQTLYDALLRRNSDRAGLA